MCIPLAPFGICRSRNFFFFFLHAFVLHGYPVIAATTVITERFFACFRKKVTMRRTSAVWWWLTAAALLLLTLCGAPAAGDGETQAPTTVLPRGDPHMVVCEDVRVRCAFNKGCSLALHNYFTKCDKSLVADPTKCPEMCMEALVTLTSTEDGKWLLDVSTRSFCFYSLFVNALFGRFRLFRWLSSRQWVH